ncbi:MAG: hypothetical protein CL554_15185, partial [Algoriphagus sp.]|uniref:DUF7507 domain-containing protein n=1 Tax=Algoriphagus sp. TaxID=1872435 RepID=UPI000C46BCE1
MKSFSKIRLVLRHLTNLLIKRSLPINNFSKFYFGYSLIIFVLISGGVYSQNQISSDERIDKIPFVDFHNLGKASIEKNSGVFSSRTLMSTPDPCSGINNLNFQNPRLISGNALQVGAVYTFQNVLTLPGNIQVHAKVRIDEVVNGSVGLFDNTSDGYPSALQPTFVPQSNRTSGQGYSVFNFEFLTGSYNTSTGQISNPTLISIPAFNAYLVDIDGITRINEFQAVTGGGTVTFGQGATEKIEAINESTEFVTRYQDKTQSSSDSDGLPINIFDRMVRVEFTNIQSFKWKFGVNYRNSQSSPNTRLFSFYVQCIPGFVPADGDYGDAPESYGTPNHAVPNSTNINSLPRLGNIVDRELTAIHSLNADGDDNFSFDLANPSSIDDEDGVTISSGGFNAGGSKQITINIRQADNSSNKGYVNAWIDWNRDGDFLDADEQVIINQGLSSGMNGNITPSITVPCDANPGDSYLRVRISKTQNLTPLGGALDGEVEDYKILITNTNNLSPVTISTQPSNLNLCQNQVNPPSLNIVANGSGTLTYQWFRNTSLSNSGGTPIPNSNSSSFTPGNSNPGIFYFYVVVTGNCKSAVSNPVEVQVNNLPAAPTSGGNITQCINSPAQTLTAQATVPEGFEIKWFTAATGGNLVTNPTLNSLGTVTYYAEARNITTGCISATRTPVTLSLLNCALTIDKVGTFVDQNNNGRADVGEKINYTFLVTNTGNAALTNVTVSDPKVSVIGSAISLAIGANSGNHFTGSYTITQNDINTGKVDNTATVTGFFGAQSRTASDNETTTLPQVPALTIVKTGTFNDTNNNGRADVNETISYTFLVTNTGNVPLTGVTVSDPKVTVSGGPISLAVGANSSNTFTGTYTITQNDINAGKVDNTATARGTFGPQDITATDDETTSLPQVPALTIVKTGTFNDTNNNGRADVNETISYT